jgi:four helix bundle protein
MKDERRKMQDGGLPKRGFADELAERLLGFAAECLKLATRLSRTAPGWHVAGQLMRSSSSSGANYEEARAAESRADFVHKMQVVLKELRESLFWLRLAARSGLVHPDDLAALLKEGDSLSRIIGKSIVTARSRM